MVEKYILLSSNARHKETRCEDNQNCSADFLKCGKNSWCKRIHAAIQDYWKTLTVENRKLRQNVPYYSRRIWFLIGVISSFAKFSSAGSFAGLEKNTKLSISPQGDNSLLQIFGHAVRVQRSASEQQHNHRSRNHLGKSRRHPGKSVTRCPPPMTRLPNDACTVNPCLSDSECPGHGESCCYNGCIYTCVHVVLPPPVIDWQTRSHGSDKTEGFDILQPNEYEGNIEFDIVPGEMLAESHRSAPIGEICSTTIEEGDILLDCPHGYICHVEDKGNPVERVPDWGRCVAINENVQENAHTLQDEYFY